MQNTLSVARVPHPLQKLLMIMKLTCILTVFCVLDTFAHVNAQTVTLTNQRNQVDILRRRMDASVLLVKALGGGWNVRDLPQL